MATEGSQQVDTASASANTLSHEKCALCLKEFTSLRMLPCFHTFCLECLKNHLKIKQNADYFSCPLCKNTGYVPLSGIEELPISSDAEDEMTVFQNADAAHICDLCKNMEAKHKCLECNQFACDACTNIHAAITASRSHTVLHLSSIKSEVICSSPPLSGSCSKHSEEKLQLYCLHCSCIICRQCKLSSHENHSVADVSVIVTLARDMLLSFNKEINDYLRPMLETIFNEVATHKKNIPDKKLLLLTEVRHRAKEIIDATNSYLAEVEKQLDKEADRISFISNNIMEEMQKQLDTFQRFCEHVEHIMQVGCDADILELPNQIGEFFGMERIEVCPPSTWRQVNHIPNLKLFMDEKWRCAIDFSFSETNPRLIQCRAMTEHIRHYLGQVEKTNKTVPDPFQVIGSSVYGYQNCKPEVTISEIIQKIQKFLAAWKPRP